MIILNKKSNNNVIFYIFFTIYLLSAVIYIQGKLVLKLDRLVLTYVPEESPLTWGDINLNYTEKYGTIINSEGYLTRDVKGDNMEVDVNITRCSNRETLDSCEHFKRLKPTNVCYFLSMKGMAWTRFVHSFNPTFTCPFKKGKYVQKDSIFDIQLFDLFPVVGLYWKVDVIYYEAKQILFKAVAEGKAVKVADNL